MKSYMIMKFLHITQSGFPGRHCPLTHLAVLLLRLGPYPWLQVTLTKLPKEWVWLVSRPGFSTSTFTYGSLDNGSHGPAVISDAKKVTSFHYKCNLIIIALL